MSSSSRTDSRVCTMISPVAYRDAASRNAVSLTSAAARVVRVRSSLSINTAARETTPTLCRLTLRSIAVASRRSKTSQTNTNGRITEGPKGEDAPEGESRRASSARQRDGMAVRFWYRRVVAHGAYSVYHDRPQRCSVRVGGAVQIRRAPGYRQTFLPPTRDRAGVPRHRWLNRPYCPGDGAGLPQPPLGITPLCRTLPNGRLRWACSPASTRGRARCRTTMCGDRMLLNGCGTSRTGVGDDEVDLPVSAGRLFAAIEPLFETLPIRAAHRAAPPPCGLCERSSDSFGRATSTRT